LAALSWAVEASQGIGLSWPAKGVLWHLANRHNPDNGCFPSQKKLAADCEVSQSQLNVHLAKLERAGLIRRVLQFDRKTGSRLPTRYRLAFEEGFEALPEAVAASEDEQPDLPLSPDQNPEIGVGVDVEDAAPPTPISEGPLLRLSGVVLEAEPVSSETVNCVPADGDHEIAHAFSEFWESHPRPKDRDASHQLFQEAVQAGEDAKAIVEAARRYATEQAGNATMYVCQSDNWLKGKRWRDQAAAGRKLEAGPVDVAAFWARLIHEGAHIPQSAIKTSTANEMIRRGLVTSEALAKVGVYA
jgi:DNA-binding transcriptional ArsR family regulator